MCDSIYQGDTKEGFYFGREIDPGSSEAKKPLHGPNQWPEEHLVPGLRETYEKYFSAVTKLCRRLLEFLALALKLPGDYFYPFFEEPMAMLRPLHYSGQVG
jgi:isopenicillin N synthase-like dioxygenase